MAQRRVPRRLGTRAGVVGLVGVLILAVCPPASGLDDQAANAAADAKPAAAAYIVQLTDEPAVAYTGGRPGLEATKPARGQKLDPTAPKVARYAAHLDARQAAILRGAGAPDAARYYGYRYSFNGFAATLTTQQVARLRRDPGVRNVIQDRLHQPQSDNTPSFLGLDAPGGLWSQVGGQDRAGEDVIVGIVDTGIWPEHPSFADQSNGGPFYDKPPRYWRGACTRGERFTPEDCNNKLIGARYFVEGFGKHSLLKRDFRSARDASGHGTHTASTAAGNAGVDPSIFGNDLGVGTISGMAPRARIAAYKACWNDEGCATTDLVAAIDTAVADGVDVINYSIGSDTPEILSPDGLAFLFADAAGVFVATSAGNAGSGDTTVGSPASAPWVIAVAASTHSRMFAATIRLGNGVRYTGASVTNALPSRPLVDGEDAGSEHCVKRELKRSVVAGRIVLCKRGVTGRLEKSEAVKAAGGVGMILYNDLSPQEIMSDNHWVPTVHVSYEDGLAIKAYIDAPGPATARLSKGTAAADAVAPIMARFSSRGPNGANGDIIRPDVTAPGVQVLAANTPAPLDSPPGELFQAISGTSMSSPHVAGVAALLVQAHRDWTPAMIRSALMTTASQNVKKEDGVTPADPFDFGAGHIQPNPANDPGLVYDVDIFDYVAFLCGADEVADSTCTGAFGIQPADPSDLNLASIGIGELAGIQTVTREVTNVGPAATYTVAVQAPPGVQVTVNPPTLTLATGQKATYTVTFTRTTAPLDSWAFGSLTWSDGAGHVVRSPIAIRPVALAAPDEFTGTGPSGSGSWQVTFGYTGPFSAEPRGLVPAVTESRTVVDDPSNDIGTALATGVGIQVHEIVVAPGTEHLRASLFDEATDGDDDLDLYLMNPAGDIVDASGSGTSAEEVNAENPVAGTWKVIVHGWQTDGPDATYTLFSWLVPGGPTGNLVVTAPTTATLGAEATITVTWSGLVPGTRYLGAVLYANGATELGRTMVEITA